MADVTTRTSEDGYDVLVGDEVAHQVETEQQATQLAAWLNFQLAQGVALDTVLGMLRGEPAGGSSSAATPSELDTTVLEGTIRALKKALASGAHDADLQALLAAELADRNRRGAVSAIEDRIEDVG